MNSTLIPDYYYFPQQQQLQPQPQQQQFTISITLYDHLCKYFLVWYLPTVITLGFFGSIFCFIFLIHSKMFTSNLLIWLISICVSDFLILLTEGIWMLLKIWYKIDIRDYNNWLCIFHTSSSNYLFYWSAYMQCLLSIQRCYLVLYPLQVKSKWISLSKLIIYQIIISILLIIPILPYPLYWQVINDDCDPVNEKIFRLTTLCDLIFWGLIPVFVMTTCTGIICRNLLTRNKFAKKTIQSNVKINQHSSYYYSSHPTKSMNDLCKSNYLEDSEIHIHSEKKSCRSESLISNQENIPTTNNSIDNNMHKFLYYLFRSFCLLSTCTNWIFYCVAGKKFRDRTKQLLLSLCNSNKISLVINENGFLIIKYTDKHRYSVSNIARTKGLSSPSN
ncbi:putative rhodopsin-like orphan GPCR [Schistosoma mansoni]|uniref:putative rhodopsin-like orphan GPCR n=1 Tax=Schistosoma mansoni TaxID=6183 RepID=UPI0001A62E77|nr:putative rhodopsin-like orphan GPCR [Schistosoma mansoni]|eukprot:XP_018649371.1 putative rhodopsin-like orphan GPCR [Schistosoma mansoni]